MGVKKIVSAVASPFSTNVPKQTPSVSKAQTEEMLNAEEAARKSKAALVQTRSQTLLTPAGGNLAGVATGKPTLLGG